MEFLWIWGILLLIAVAFKFSNLHLSIFQRTKTLTRLPSFYSSCGDDDDDDASSSSSNTEEEEDEMEEEESEGTSSFSLADLAGGKGVVKICDGLTEMVYAEDEVGGAVVRVWDDRAGDEAMGVFALPLLRRRVAGVVGDDEGRDVVAVMDLRKFGLVERGESCGSWWRSAGKCLTLLSPRMNNA